MQEQVAVLPLTEAAPAMVVDLGRLLCVEATVYGLNEDGCTVVCDEIHLLRDEIGLRLNDVKTMLRGKVVSQSGNQAQILFSTSQGEPVEKRGEPRRPVLITAVVCSRVGSETLRCHIVDASKSGCRLESDQLHKLPNEIEISIPKLDQPIAGTIVWRSGEHAGVSLKWPFAEAAEQSALRNPKKPDEADAEDRPAARVRRRARGGAFGIR